MYEKLKHFFFYLDPEPAHDLVESLMHLGGEYGSFVMDKCTKQMMFEHETLKQTILGINFPNPVGLAAGFDKNATMTKALAYFGFGAIELGTITPKPQSGNPKPRLFRYVAQESIQNAMGFNNDGLEKVAQRVRELYPFRIPLGINIGKNKLTSEENALGDYETLLKGFRGLGDYVVINISSPNTPGLRDLQNEGFIKALFEMAKHQTSAPIFLKIAPDMSTDDAIALSTLAVQSGASGIIATNTTIDYSLLPDARNFGGLSGKVLTQKSRELFGELAKALYGKTTLVSVGGIDSAQEAYTRIKMGANLVQLYTSFIFKGPKLVSQINEDLVTLLKHDGFSHISEAVGADIR